jgi:hypothetical protein
MKTPGMKKIVLLLTIIITGAGSALAEVIVPFHFTPGATISSSEVNSNFSTLRNAMPAVKQNKGVIWVAVPTSGTTVQSITVTPPADGYVTVMAAGSVNVNSTSSEGNTCLDLSDTANYIGGCIPMQGSTTAWRSHLPANFGNDIGLSYSIVETFAVTAGNTYTYYLSGYATGFSSPYLFHPTLTVIFVPNALP